MVLAFEDWYGPAHSRVVGVVFVACGDVEIARDSADEAFARALDRWPRVSELASPTTWVCRVAINVMRRRMRRRSLESRLLGRARSEPAYEHETGYPEIWNAVRALPERQRISVVLRYVADLPEAEIATAMGVTRGTVSASLAAAKTKLARSLSNLDATADQLMEFPNA